MGKKKDSKVGMNWLVTGGCGFIGVNLIYHLLKKHKGHRVRVIDNLLVGKREDLASIGEFVEITGDEISGAINHRLELIVHDIRDREFALKASQGVDIIVHLAAHAGVIPSIRDPRYDCEVNVLGTLNYIESARINGIKKFIFASSGAPLGQQSPPIHEEKVPKPISPYGASKLAGEAYCMAYHGSFGLQTIILRFGNVYGPRSSHKNSVIAKFIKQALKGEPLPIYGDGSQTRDFIYVDDLIDAIMIAAYTNIGGEIFQIATHQETTVNEIAVQVKKIFEELTRKSVQIIYNDQRIGEIKRNFSDISKARRLLGFEPKYTIDYGLSETIKWFMNKDYDCN